MYAITLLINQESICRPIELEARFPDQAMSVCAIDSGENERSRITERRNVGATTDKGPNPVKKIRLEL